MQTGWRNERVVSLQWAEDAVTLSIIRLGGDEVSCSQSRGNVSTTKKTLSPVTENG